VTTKIKISNRIHSSITKIFAFTFSHYKMDSKQSQNLVVNLNLAAEKIDVDVSQRERVASAVNDCTPMSSVSAPGFINKDTPGNKLHGSFLAHQELASRQSSAYAHSYRSNSKSNNYKFSGKSASASASPTNMDMQEREKSSKSVNLNLNNDAGDNTGENTPAESIDFDRSACASPAENFDRSAGASPAESSAASPTPAATPGSSLAAASSPTPAATPPSDSFATTGTRPWNRRRHRQQQRLLHLPRDG
jgi:hypothetical protein